MVVNKDAIETSYQEMRRVVGNTVHKFIQKYGEGKDRADIESDAWLGYCQAYLSYDPEKTKAFSTWVVIKAWHAMLTGYRTRTIRWMKWSKTASIHKFDDNLPCNKERFNLADFLQGLSQEAQDVVMLAVAPCLDIKHNMVARGKSNSAPSLRIAIKQFLQEIGWTADKIAECFEEVREALK